MSSQPIKSFITIRNIDQTTRLDSATNEQVVNSYQCTEAVATIGASLIQQARSGAVAFIAGVRGVGKSHLLAFLRAIITQPELIQKIEDPFARRRLEQIIDKKALSQTMVTINCDSEQTDVSLLATRGDAQIEAACATGKNVFIFIDGLSLLLRRSKRDECLQWLTKLTANVSANRQLFITLDKDLVDSALTALSPIRVKTVLETIPNNNLAIVLDQFICPKKPEQKRALDNLYRELCQKVPHFQWSQQDFLQVFPLHPQILELAPALRTYARTFSLLSFFYTVAPRAIMRRGFNLISLVEVFDTFEYDLRRNTALSYLFTTYDYLLDNFVKALPSTQQFHGKFLLRAITLLSLQEKSFTAMEIADSVMIFDDSPPVLFRQSVKTIMDFMATAAAEKIIVTNEGEKRFQLCLVLKSTVDPIEEATKEIDDDDSRLVEILIDSGKENFKEWPLVFSEDNNFQRRAETDLFWRGTIRRGILKLGGSSELSGTNSKQKNLEWQLTLTSSASLTQFRSEAPENHVFRYWYSDTLTNDEIALLKRLLIIRQKGQDLLNAEELKAEDSYLTMQVAKIFTRCYLESGFLANAQEQNQQAVPYQEKRLQNLLGQMLDLMLKAKFPRHPNFGDVLNERIIRVLARGFFYTSEWSLPELKKYLGHFALPLHIVSLVGENFEYTVRSDIPDDSALGKILSALEKSYTQTITRTDIERLLLNEPFGLQQPMLLLLVLGAAAAGHIILTNDLGEIILTNAGIRSGSDITNYARVCSPSILYKQKEETNLSLKTDSTFKDTADTAIRDAVAGVLSNNPTTTQEPIAKQAKQEKAEEELLEFYQSGTFQRPNIPNEPVIKSSTITELPSITKITKIKKGASETLPAEKQAEMPVSDEENELLQFYQSGFFQRPTISGEPVAKSTSTAELPSITKIKKVNSEDSNKYTNQEPTSDLTSSTEDDELLEFYQSGLFARPVLNIPDSYQKIDHPQGVAKDHFKISQQNPPLSLDARLGSFSSQPLSRTLDSIKPEAGLLSQLAELNKLTVKSPEALPLEKAVTSFESESPSPTTFETPIETTSVETPIETSTETPITTNEASFSLEQSNQSLELNNFDNFNNFGDFGDFEQKPDLDSSQLTNSNQIDQQLVNLTTSTSFSDVSVKEEVSTNNVVNAVSIPDFSISPSKPENDFSDLNDIMDQPAPAPTIKTKPLDKALITEDGKFDLDLEIPKKVAKPEIQPSFDLNNVLANFEADRLANAPTLSELPIVDVDEPNMSILDMELSPEMLKETQKIPIIEFAQDNPFQDISPSHPTIKLPAVPFIEEEEEDKDLEDKLRKFATLSELNKITQKLPQVPPLPEDIEETENAQQQTLAELSNIATNITTDKIEPALVEEAQQVQQTEQVQEVQQVQEIQEIDDIYLDPFTGVFEAVTFPDEDDESAPIPTTVVNEVAQAALSKLNSNIAPQESENVNNNTVLDNQDNQVEYDTPKAISRLQLDAPSDALTDASLTDTSIDTNAIISDTSDTNVNTGDSFSEPTSEQSSELTDHLLTEPQVLTNNVPAKNLIDLNLDINNLDDLVINEQNMAPQTEPIAESYTEPYTEPVAEQPIAEPYTEPVAESYTEPVAEQPYTEQSYTEPYTEPVAETVDSSFAQSAPDFPMQQPVTFNPAEASFANLLDPPASVSPIANTPINFGQSLTPANIIPSTTPQSVFPSVNTGNQFNSNPFASNSFAPSSNRLATESPLTKTPSKEKSLGDLLLGISLNTEPLTPSIPVTEAEPSPIEYVPDEFVFGERSLFNVSKEEKPKMFETLPATTLASESLPNEILLARSSSTFAPIPPSQAKSFTESSTLTPSSTNTEKPQPPANIWEGFDNQKEYGFDTIMDEGENPDLTDNTDDISSSSINTKNILDSSLPIASLPAASFNLASNASLPNPSSQALESSFLADNNSLPSSTITKLNNQLVLSRKITNEISANKELPTLYSKLIEVCRLYNSPINIPSEEQFRFIILNTVRHLKGQNLSSEVLCMLEIVDGEVQLNCQTNRTSLFQKRNARQRIF